MLERTKLLWLSHKITATVVCLVVLATVASSLALARLREQRQVIQGLDQLASIEYSNFSKASQDLQNLQRQATDAQKAGLDISGIQTEIKGAATSLFKDRDLARTSALIKEIAEHLVALRAQKLPEAASETPPSNTEGQLTGSVKEGKTAISKARVSLLVGTSELKSTNSSSSGNYSLNAPAGKYNVEVSKSGYITYRKYDVELTAANSTKLDINLSKVGGASGSTNGGTGNSSESADASGGTGNNNSGGISSDDGSGGDGGSGNGGGTGGTGGTGGSGDGGGTGGGGTVDTSGSHAYGGNFGTSGSFYLSYDYEFENGVPVRHMRVFQSGHVGLINADIETVIWSPNTTDATFYGHFTAKGVTYNLRCEYFITKGLRAAQFFVHDSNNNVIASTTAMRATVFSFKSGYHP